VLVVVVVVTTTIITTHYQNENWLGELFTTVMTAIRSHIYLVMMMKQQQRRPRQAVGSLSAAPLRYYLRMLLLPTRGNKC
jgi:uncharacterized protein (UPF0303 family)